MATALEKPVLSGTIHSTGGELGTWDATVDDCGSGEILGFFGVDFYAGKELRLRLVKDPAQGLLVKVLVPGTQTALVLGPDECTTLNGDVRKTNIFSWTPKGNVNHLEGEVTFDCTHTNGQGRVTGELTFAHCH